MQEIFSRYNRHIKELLDTSDVDCPFVVIDSSVNQTLKKVTKGQILKGQKEPDLEVFAKNQKTMIEAYKEFLEDQKYSEKSRKKCRKEDLAEQAKSEEKVDQKQQNSASKADLEAEKNPKNLKGTKKESEQASRPKKTFQERKQEKMKKRI